MRWAENPFRDAIRKAYKGKLTRSGMLIPAKAICPRAKRARLHRMFCGDSLKTGEGQLSMAVDHKGRARQAWPYVARRATRGLPPYTYAEISAKIGVHHRVARYFLDVIQDECAARKWPPLQALAVRKDTRLPGTGYRGSAITHEAHQRALKAVYRHRWPEIAPFK